MRKIPKNRYMASTFLASANVLEAVSLALNLEEDEAKADKLETVIDFVNIRLKKALELYRKSDGTIEEQPKETPEEIIKQMNDLSKRTKYES